MIWTVPMMVLLFALGVACGVFCRRRIGGQTGDTLGAAVELGDVTALFVMAAALF